MSKFAEIAFPTAVRRLFTYEVGKDNSAIIQLGMRVWVPFRSHNAIGVVVDLHDEKPSFKTKKIRKVLDEKPVLSSELLFLTEWVHQFYYCSWGEVIQAALPAGLNFISQKKVKVAESHETEISPEEKEILDLVRESSNKNLEFQGRRWKNTSQNKLFKNLLKKEVLEIWEEPEIKISSKKERAWVWKEGINKKQVEEYLEKTEKRFKWVESLEAFSKLNLPVRSKNLDKKQFSSFSLKKLQEEGWIGHIDVEVDSQSLQLDYKPEEIKQLNENQEKVFEVIQQAINTQKFSNFLLRGITGSGKTEVYIHALRKVRDEGKGGIVLVPEIALTPQTVSRFYKVFGDDIAVLHSRMSDRERLDSWKKIQNGEKNIAIGARSAVFAPIRNLGLIVIDEEHDASYKQSDPAPRYHAREVAIVRANKSNAVVLMGSATPSMQALQMTAKGKARLLEIDARHKSAELPEVQILDLKKYSGAMRGELSVPMFLEIEAALSRKEQVILLYNRRGFANYLQCETCGHIPQSPECSVSLTYHKRKNLLMCHYSGYSRKADTSCEKCGSEQLSERGSGTQKIEEQLEELFPKAKIIRFDRDSTSRKGKHEQILSTFAEGKADIMVGTQLVAKGLDFPNVTVVGVIDADTELAYPSFQSSEKMFQLLSQVSGRSGRGNKPGKVFIQTRLPENEALRFAQKHDFKGFAKSELKFRDSLNYPPYSRLVKFVLKGKKENEVRATSFVLKNVVERVVPKFEVLGPSPAAIAWMNKNYIWEITLKLPTEKGHLFIEKMLDTIHDVYEKEAGKRASSIRINVNVEAIR